MSVARADAAAQAAAEPHRGFIIVAIMLATIMQALDTTIANVALPNMQGSLSATQDQISWVLTSYIVAAAIMTPPAGFLAARFGRKRLFAWSVTGFTVASLLCGIATSLPEMTRQAASVAYIDDFLLMTYVTLAALPFVLLLRPPRRAKAPPGEVAAAAE